MKPRITPDILDVFKQMKAVTVEYDPERLAERRAAFELEARRTVILIALRERGYEMPISQIEELESELAGLDIRLQRDGDGSDTSLSGQLDEAGFGSGGIF
jgi:hypothetical protein